MVFHVLLEFAAGPPVGATRSCGTNNPTAANAITPAAVTPRRVLESLAEKLVGRFALCIGAGE
jgi:hypothetical protein